VKEVSHRITVSHKTATACFAPCSLESCQAWRLVCDPFLFPGNVIVADYRVCRFLVERSVVMRCKTNSAVRATGIITRPCTSRGTHGVFRLVTRSYGNSFDGVDQPAAERSAPSPEEESPATEPRDDDVRITASFLLCGNDRVRFTRPNPYIVGPGYCVRIMLPAVPVHHDECIQTDTTDVFFRNFRHEVCDVSAPLVFAHCPYCGFPASAHVGASPRVCKGKATRRNILVASSLQVLPDNLMDSLNQAAEATTYAISKGIERCSAEILLPEFWDPISGAVFSQEGDQMRFWRLARRFADDLISMTGCTNVTVVRSRSLLSPIART
jgi:hypothetical protein